MLRATTAALACAALTTGAALAEGPLQSIARHVPLAAEGEIYLLDIAASARQVAALPVDDERGRPFMPLAPLAMPTGFDDRILLMSPDGFREALGFSVFEIGQMAGWGQLPDAPLVMRSPVFARDSEAIAAALAARDFTREDRAGTPVWHRQEDNQPDFRRRSEEPFNGSVGMAQRFALDGDILRHARSWKVMDRLLAGGSSLLDDPDAAAVLSAATERTDAGDLLDMILLGPQPSRMSATQLVLPRRIDDATRDRMLETYRKAGPGLPPFRRYGLALWQRGTWMTGAILIPYPDRATAEAARLRFTELLVSQNSLVATKPFDELLPASRQFETVEAGDRAVLVLAFGTEADTSNGIALATFVRNPRALLFQMVLTRDLDLLVGAAQ
jgi:hypothetical protein